jgi:hypothetical protein
MVGGEQIVVVRPAPRDKFGDPSGDSDTETVSEGWLFAPGASNELHEGQNSVDTDAELYRMGAPGAEDIRPTDRVRVRGMTFEVIGEPAIWRLGTVVRLRRFRG